VPLILPLPISSWAKAIGVIRDKRNIIKMNGFKDLFLKTFFTSASCSIA
jgi:hypothetical protein